MPGSGHRAAAAVAAFSLAIIAILTLLLPPSVSRVAASTPNVKIIPPVAQEAPALTCVTGATHFYADDDITAKEGPYAFGLNPDKNGAFTAPELAEMLSESLCFDWKLVDVYWHVVVDHKASVNRSLTTQQWADEVQVLDRRIDWASAEVAVNTVAAGMQTYEMILQAHGPPIVKEVSLIPAHRTSRWLYVGYRDSNGQVHVLTIRIPCRFQPLP